MANEVVETCYRGDDSGRAIHLLGPLAGKVVRISPPLTMLLDECKEYMDVMFDLLSSITE